MFWCLYYSHCDINGRLTGSVLCFKIQHCKRKVKQTKHGYGPISTHGQILANFEPPHFDPRWNSDPFQLQFNFVPSLNPDLFWPSLFRSQIKSLPISTPSQIWHISTPSHFDPKSNPAHVGHSLFRPFVLYLTEVMASMAFRSFVI